MKVGTKSLLFGVHAFWWHPITVWRAWVKLYGDWPSFRECVCIFIHDFGYWGCPNMDGPEGEMHPEGGAFIAALLLGPAEHDLVRWHSRTLAKKFGRKPSKLCWADKASMKYDPTWFYLFRARLSGELVEYRQRADKHDFVPLAAPHHVWHRKLADECFRNSLVEARKA